ncbi:MAG: hypothetical protein KatS3mg068_1311 [Candidatus Sericytochromatia bacterium]|nr:MAG: hypothetical protein KatS3mg068_1311 [Candidatus Sericytochromatia bacterium]
MKKNKGYAMVSTLAISSVLLLAVGVMMYKINSNTKDIIRAKLNAQALNVAEEGIEHTLNWLNVQNTSTQTPPLLNTLLTSNLNLPGVISTNNVFKSVKENGEFEIFLSSTGTATSTFDFVEVKSIGYIPSKNNFRARKIVKTVVERPLVANGQGIDSAMHTDGTISVGNGKTNSGNSPIPTTFTSEGHIHSNSTISLGANAQINGDITAVNGITGLSSDKVTGTANPSASPIPVPQAKYEIDSTPCIMTLIGTKKEIWTTFR